MTRWKYLFVSCDSNPQTKDWQAHYINGKELPDWLNGPTMYQVSDDLGDKGWELAGYHAAENRIRLVFKRPVE